MGRKPRPERDGCAILILEAPWGLYDTDSNIASVLPFFEGMTKLYDNVDVFHANFYDIHSFELAFQHLAKTRYDNTIVYIAAHGYKGKIEDGSVSDYVAIVNAKAKVLNITGIVVGACYSAEDEQSLVAQVEGSGLRWCVGYRSSVAWVSGTMIDLSIIENLLVLYASEDPDPLSKEDEIVTCFRAALNRFNPNQVLGEYYSKRAKVKLRNSLCVVVQAAGHGKRARPIPDELLFT